MKKEDINKIKEFILKNGENDGVGTLVYLSKKCENGMDCINVNVLDGKPFAFLSSENDDEQFFVPVEVVFDTYEDFMDTLNHKDEKKDHSLFDNLLKHLGLYDAWVKQGGKGTIGGKDKKGDLFIFRNTEKHPYTLRAYSNLKSSNKVEFDFDYIWNKYMANGGLQSVEAKMKDLFQWRNKIGMDIPLPYDIIFDAVKPTEEKAFASVSSSKKVVDKETYTLHEKALISARELTREVEKDPLALGLLLLSTFAMK